MNLQPHRVEFSPYSLRSRVGGVCRSGSLLRVTFADGLVGFADVHPWTEFGDAPLADQIAGLRQGNPPPLVCRSLDFARLDAEARAERRSLWEGVKVPPSHASLPFGFSTDDLDRVRSEGYRHVKLKEVDFTDAALKLLADSGLRVRLDFNARLTADEVADRLHRWRGSVGLDWLEWIEDPCLVEPEDWKQLRAEFGIALALDWGEDGSQMDFYDVRVVKPARENILELIPPPGGVCFTSYLDHPLGQAAAAYTASVAARDGASLTAAGLASHKAFEPNAFSAYLSAAGPGFWRDEADRSSLFGAGFGFDLALATVGWSD